MRNDHDTNASSEVLSEKRSPHTSTMDQARQQSPSSSSEGRRYAAGDGHSSSNQTGKPVQGSSETWDHLRSRYPERIRPEDLDRLEEQIDLAFKQANPAEAWKLTQKLMKAARTLSTEAAKARFKINFGTEVCERCEGLRAGENVVATCYQIRLCHYGNVKKDLTPRQRGVINNLGQLQAPPKKM